MTTPALHMLHVARCMQHAVLCMLHATRCTLHLACFHGSGLGGVCCMLSGCMTTRMLHTCHVCGIVMRSSRPRLGPRPYSHQLYPYAVPLRCTPTLCTVRCAPLCAHHDVRQVYPVSACITEWKREDRLCSKDEIIHDNCVVNGTHIELRGRACHSSQALMVQTLDPNPRATDHARMQYAYKSVPVRCGRSRRSSGCSASTRSTGAARPAPTT